MAESRQNIVQLFADARAPVEASRSAGSSVPYSGAYQLRGRWLSEQYGPLRNAAWAARNSRGASNLNPLALKLVLAESEKLMAEGEPLGDVLEAFAELLMRP